MITRWLTRITMYRLMLYYLLVVVALAAILGAARVLPYNPAAIIGQTLTIAAVALAVNTLCSRLLNLAPNLESVYITALILSLIVGPAATAAHLGAVAAITAIAIGSKYVLVYRRKHIFNPAAFGAVVGALTLGTGASWWVGNSVLFFPVLLGGLLILKIIRRHELVLAFLLTYVAGLLVTGVSVAQLPGLVINSPLIFFMLVMLVEPQTSPGQARERIAFGAVVAVGFIALLRLLPSASFGLELSLLLGNLYAFAFGMSRGALLTLAKKQTLAPGIMSFWFSPDHRVSFTAGQYLEITVPHSHPDSRGVRRYFTIASSPAEKELLITSRFSSSGSTFKQVLQMLTAGARIAMHSIAGDFVLPKKPAAGYVFIAGGIGITPFRSIINQLIEKSDRAPATLFYSNKTSADFVFDDVFGSAEKKIGLKRVYTVTEEKTNGWRGERGPIDPAMIKKHVPDYKSKLFFVSGPEPMVEAFRAMLRGMGISRGNIKTDFFPGYPSPDKPALKRP